MKEIQAILDRLATIEERLAKLEKAPITHEQWDNVESVEFYRWSEKDFQ